MRNEAGKKGKWGGGDIFVSDIVIGSKIFCKTRSNLASANVRKPFSYSTFLFPRDNATENKCVLKNLPRTVINCISVLYVANNHTRTQFRGVGQQFRKAKLRELNN